MLSSNNSIHSLHIVKKSLGFVAIFEKIYDGGARRAVEEVKGITYVSTVSQPDTIPLLGNNFCFQMTETRF